MRLTLTLLVALAVSGCANHKLTGYNLKGSAGQTHNDDGSKSFYTGGSIDAHFDVR